jgi:ATPase subunit of ABC transporter with duplicated ATPase domains
LIRQIVASLNLQSSRVLYIPQEVTHTTSRELLAKITDLPPDSLGLLMTIVSRLNSRPVNLITSQGPSPGETRKLMLALGILQQPHIIIMDEPTNHMDLPSITCLEKALKDCPCAILLASHDRVFLSAITQIRWDIAASEPGHFKLAVS